MELQAVDEGAVPASAPVTSWLFVLPVAARRWVSTHNNVSAVSSFFLLPILIMWRLSSAVYKYMGSRWKIEEEPMEIIVIT